MTNVKSRFDQAFLDRQKHRLTELRKQLLGVREGQASEQVSANAAGAGQASAYEDAAQKVSTLELQGNLAAVANARRSAGPIRGSALTGERARISRLRPLNRPTP